MRYLMMAALLASPAMAADCPNPAAWTKPQQHRAARTPDLKFALPANTSHQLGLSPAAQVRFVTGKVSRKGNAGVAALDIPRAGTLTVMASNRTYIDLVRDGRTLELAGEPGHPDCAGVRKALIFKVTPGRYIVQLSGSEERTMKLATILR